MKGINRLALTAIIATLLCIDTPAFADIPTTLSYTGFLADASGPYDGLVDVDITFYDDPGAGDELWSDSLTDVAVVQGLLNIRLGRAEAPFAFDWAAETDVWAELSIEGEVMLPRQHVDSVPFALVAAQALAAETAVGALADQLTDHATRLGDYGTRLGSLEGASVDWTDVGGKPGWLNNDTVDWAEVAGRPDDLDDGKLQWSNIEGIGADLSAAFTDLADGLLTWSRVESLPDLIARFEDETHFTSAVNGTGFDIFFEGVNLHVQNGQDSTWGAPEGDPGDGTPNGLGNIVVGYNESEDCGSATPKHGGSHNVVIGSCHTYSNYGGLVAGHRNSVLAFGASASGGSGNTASGDYSSVCGGGANQAPGDWATVSGGQSNTASGELSSVSGGRINTASSRGSSVAGGVTNIASGTAAAVFGGSNNTSVGDYASVTGGAQNTASGTCSSVTGGRYNETNVNYTSVSGGSHNTAGGFYSSISGGRQNTTEAGSIWTSISGGQNNVASGGDDDGHVAGGSVSGGGWNTASGNQSSVSGGFERTAADSQDWRAGSLFEDN